MSGPHKEAEKDDQTKPPLTSDLFLTSDLGSRHGTHAHAKTGELEQKVHNPFRNQIQKGKKEGGGGGTYVRR